MDNKDTFNKNTLFENDEAFNPVSSAEERGPVTVLGITFENEEDCRNYFREELRRRLPELREISGFPIAEDEDIIALSDPPYYTACPNPWLNEFIQQWEEEKKVLEKEGKRIADWEVNQPYASDVKEGKNNPVYTAHTYHTKVPHPAIMRYILHYTQPGDVVYDGFAGTGMTGVAAQACGNPSAEIKQKINSEWSELFQKQPLWGQRHAICGDLSPYASLISYNYNTPLNKSLLEKEVNRIYDELKEECGWLYTTLHANKEIGTINYMVWSEVFLCNNCGEEFVYWDAAIDVENKCLRDNFTCSCCGTIHSKKTVRRSFERVYDKGLNQTVSEVKTVPSIVVYTVNGKRFEKRADDYDILKIRKIMDYDLQCFYPLNALPYGYNTEQPKRCQGIGFVHQFYTKRNLIALSHFYAKINQSALPNKIKFIFTGMINRSTKMNRVHINNYFYGGGGWNAGHLKGTLYVPSLPVETSIFEQVKDKLNSYLRAVDHLPRIFDNALMVASANDCPIEDNTIDYIFVDPPFGANIMYSELNFLPEAWLKVITNNENESIVNEVQQKNSSFYLNMMSECFAEFYRILKPGKWMTVEFSNTSASIWSSIQQSITKAGFVIANVSALNKGQGGMRSITTTTAVKQDLAISCYKPSVKFMDKFTQNVGVETIWDFVEEHLSHLPVYLGTGKSTTGVIERDKRILFDRMVSYYVQHGYSVPMNAQEFQQKLHERFIERDGMYFTAEQVIEYDDRKRHAPDFVPMALFIGSEAEGIEWLKRKLEVPQTYQELQPQWMQDLALAKKGDRLPELMDILDENFLKDEDGKWRRPDMEKEIDLENMRIKKLLREFNLYIEMASKPKVKIKEARLEALRTGFKDCYKRKDFQSIMAVAAKLPEQLLLGDEILLQYYDIACSKI